MSTRAVLQVLVAAAALAAGLVPAAGAWAGQPTPTTGGHRLRLASQTSWAAPASDFVLRVVATTDRPPADVELAVAVHRRVSSRSEFGLTLDDRVRGAALTAVATPLSELTVDAGGALVVRLPVHAPGEPAERGALRLRDEGVYPVKVELREAGGGDVLARLTTHLVYAVAPTEGGRPLGVGLVMPVHAPPALRPDGSRRLPARRADAIAVLARALAARADVSVTVQPTGETLDALRLSDRAVDRDTLSALARALAPGDVVRSTYVPVAPAAFDDLAGESASQRERGAAAVQAAFQLTPDRHTAVLHDPVDEQSLQRFREQEVERLVLPDRHLAPVDLDVTLAQPFELETRQVRRLRALAADGGLTAHFERRDPVLAAHQLLADLAVIYFDRPGRPRAVVALPPRDWQPDPTFLDTLLEGVASSPVLAAAPLAALFDVPPATTGRGVTLVRRVADPGEGAPQPTLPAAAIREARRRLEGFASMLDTDNRLVGELEASLLVSESAELRASERQAYLAGIERRISAELGLIRVPDERTITLTARRGDIPVTVLSEAAYRVRVTVQVTSDKLGFPGGASRPVELTRRNTTEQFAVEARTSGAFPLRVRLVSPDGTLVVGESRFTVRSTAFSGVGVVLSTGALGVLLLWWARHLLAGRRNRRLVPA